MFRPATPLNPEAKEFFKSDDRRDSMPICSLTDDPAIKGIRHNREKLYRLIREKPEQVWERFCRKYESLQSSSYKLTGELAKIEALWEETKAERDQLAQEIIRLQAAAKEAMAYEAGTDRGERNHKDLVDDLAATKASLAVITGERDSLFKENAQVTSERDQARNTIVDYVARMLKQAEGASSHPAILSDGNNVEFNTWKSEIRRKLAADSGYYPTAIHRLIYVSSRCEGFAKRHIDPRLCEGAICPYQDADDILKHLSIIFANRRTQAQVHYKELFMNYGDNFQVFLATFLRLSDETKRPEINRKRDIYSKLPRQMQTLMLEAFTSLSTPFDIFVEKCQEIPSDITLQFNTMANTKETKKVLAPAVKQTIMKDQKPVSNDRTSGTQTTLRDGTPIPILTSEQKHIFLREGKCFACEGDHVYRDCPHRRPVS
ncbi:hypothetical protein N7495_007848 [Penicillium taxi]|uniref:uncharacterized protein n=1 Tax=Penicillium taxi TaxID=168475 RepID=UPI0025452E1D|nr:uncharacterized protein N7495_007848 [Penicillium taxi]KAJ5887807.1 hypothetical protein N7495_007848 [Penicillium taxi]